MREVIVDVGSYRYPVFIDRNALSFFPEWVKNDKSANRILLVTDEMVWKDLGPVISKRIDETGLPWSVVKLMPGEVSKGWDGLRKVIDRCVIDFLDKRSFVVSFGGGVVGDVAGLASALYFRGTKFVQIPTTLLSQIDSSIGGKFSINHDEGKNLVGVVRQPQGVFCDISLLDQLPERQWRNGLAEMFKASIIRDANLFDRLSKWPAELKGAISDEELLNVIMRCVQIKAAVVGEDEHEYGVRRHLYFGHTFGHAFELYAMRPETFLHGEAVSLGMQVAIEVSRRLGHLPDAEADRALKALKGQFPFRLPENFSMERLYRAIIHDKKVEGDKIRFILLRKIGVAFDELVSLSWIRDNLESLVSVIK
ncbi:MAG: 3-dehydroquinate synthase [Planctomycetes bacterium]|nr:3-dehydroquinate synthase [Planctomycetota bacterium]